MTNYVKGIILTMKAMLCFKLSCLTLLLKNFLILVITFCRAKDLAYLFITHTYTHTRAYTHGWTYCQGNPVGRKKIYKLSSAMEGLMHVEGSLLVLGKNGSCDSWLWNKMIYLPYCSPHLGHKGEWGKNSCSPNWGSRASSGHSHYRDWLHAMDLLLAQEQKTDVNSWEDWWALREYIFTTHVHVIFRE